VVPRYLFSSEAYLTATALVNLTLFGETKPPDFQIIAALISSLPYNENPFAENLDDPNSALKST
jgi:hypothetical protein